jgi:hypothetical protein
MSVSTNDNFSITVQDSLGLVTFNCGFLGAFFTALIDNTGRWQFGPNTLVPMNSAAVQISGDLTARAQPKNVGGLFEYDIDREIDSHVMFYNTNATDQVTLRLPNMAFAGFNGFYFWAVANDATFPMIVEAQNGSVIYLNGVAGAANGSVQSLVPGTVVQVMNVDALTWVVSDASNTWFPV